MKMLAPEADLALLELLKALAAQNLREIAENLPRQRRAGGYRARDTQTKSKEVSKCVNMKPIPRST
jgi:hypothetical protein